YSHWTDAPLPPAAIAADTSTEMVVNAAANAARWLDPYAIVCNNHIDADGLLALAAACQPELARAHARLLIGAAEAGDFMSWPGREPFLLMLRLHQLIRDEQVAGPGWEQRACVRAVDGLADLIAESGQPDGERDAEVARVESAINRLTARDGFSIDTYDRIAVISWRGRNGHRSDSFLAIDEDDDLPVWAIGCAVPEHLFQLLAMETPDGTVYQLDAPRYSWARMVNRASVAWPDLSIVRERLQAAESGSCRWVDRPLAARLGFVCQLASASGDRTAPSALAAAHVVYACRSALEADPAG
ncbi:MAG: hypothetical protein H0W83_16790, partial [Planctomycetes bacterium]|nr:hypothetical protein [Planctomycetota bacterium]